MILSIAAGASFFIFKSESKLNKNFETAQKSEKYWTRFTTRFPFKLGLDLSGGSHLVYKADVSGLDPKQISSSMDALRDVIERRVNLFGVSEPLVQVQSGNLLTKGEQKLIVDLPGVTDVEQAVIMIGQTPLLEFKIEKPKSQLNATGSSKDEPQKVVIDKDGKANIELSPDDLAPEFVATELTGRYLKRAILNFDQNTREPQIGLQFDETGTKLFAEITKANIGKQVAIYLDGAPISAPVVREEITAGEAVISGDFKPKDAKILVGRLNSGALPVPISLLSKQNIGAILGENAINAGVKAGVVGFLLLAIFLIILYRLPGIIAVLALSIYVILMLIMFKLFSITLTAAGIAGFIISIGIAVDANVLIFERMKEELRSGKKIVDSIASGFDRAWSSIRDSNISNILTALILFYFGTPLIQGFALTFGFGVLISMFSAIIITKIFLSIFSFGFFCKKEGKVVRFLFGGNIANHETR